MGSASILSYSPGVIAGMEAAKAQTEARWARRSSKVTVRVMSPEELAEHRTQVAERRKVRSR
jgi:hypothetical protein